MKGKTTIFLNSETVKEAIQSYLKTQLVDQDFRVSSVRIERDAYNNKVEEFQTLHATIEPLPSNSEQEE